MTAQYSDCLQLAGEYYALVGITSDDCRPVLFDPRAHGMDPKSPSTACWRGYIAEYGLRDDRLVLENLEIHLARFSREYPTGPELNGVAPSRLPRSGGAAQFNNYYYDVGLPLLFTGGLLLARGFIEDLYEHMGFHPAWKYRTVFELAFRDGLLIAKHDRSTAMEEQRKAHIAEGGKDSNIYRSPEAMLQWIEKCFDRRY